jgi:uncharacterized Zn-finger protein
MGWSELINHVAKCYSEFVATPHIQVLVVPIRFHCTCREGPCNTHKRILLRIKQRYALKGIGVRIRRATSGDCYKLVFNKQK